MPSRKADPLWEALVAACGYSAGALFTKSERGRLNRALAELREVSATPADVLARAKQYRAMWPGITLSPQALVNNWNRCEPPKPRYRQPDEVQTSYEREVLTPEERALNSQRFRDLTSQLFKASDE